MWNNDHLYSISLICSARTVNIRTKQLVSCTSCIHLTVAHMRIQNSLLFPVTGKKFQLLSPFPTFKVHHVVLFGAIDWLVTSWIINEYEKTCSTRSLLFDGHTFTKNWNALKPRHVHRDYDEDQCQVGIWHCKCQLEHTTPTSIVWLLQLE